MIWVTLHTASIEISFFLFKILSNLQIFYFIVQCCIGMDQASVFIKLVSRSRMSSIFWIAQRDSETIKAWSFKPEVQSTELHHLSKIHSIVMSFWCISSSSQLPPQHVLQAVASSCRIRIVIFVCKPVLRDATVLQPQMKEISQKE